MDDLHWIRITALDTLPLREGRSVTVAGREIALFNLGHRVLATDNQCPHQGGPLCDGIVTGVAVVCPLHAWKIDLESGCVLRPPTGPEARVETYATRVVEGMVLIGLPPDVQSDVSRTPESAADVCLQRHSLAHAR